MTQRNDEERWWKAMADLADENIAPLDITDRRILRASQQAVAISPVARRSRWIPLTAAACLGVLGIGLAYHQHAPVADNGGAVMPADAGNRAAAPVQAGETLDLDFAPGDANLSPRAVEDLEALASRHDLCAAGVRIDMAAPGALSAERGKAVAARMKELVGGRCTPAPRLTSGGTGDRARISINIP